MDDNTDNEEQEIKSNTPIQDNSLSPNNRGSTLPDYDVIYENVQRQQRLQGLHDFTPEISNLNLAHQFLVPSLRSYQENAVRWMIRQEKTSKFKGGILADEMGLGKTVEVLALVLNNPGENKVIIPEKDVIKTEVTKTCPKKRKRLKSEEKNVKKACEKCKPRSKSNWLESDDPQKVVIQEVVDKFCQKIPKNKKQKCTCNKSVLREKLTEYYNATLNEFHVSSSKRKCTENEESSDNLRCPCGGSPKKSSPVVKCLNCGKTQHSLCVNYDLEDRYRGDYYCPQCWSKRELINSNVTLIITPGSISYQWAEEISRHINSSAGFPVLVYKGIGKDGYLQPLKLAQYDIIITTYEVLRKELYFADVKVSDTGRPQRRSSFYMAPPSPLLSVCYWRICLDEAQMVEGSTTRAAEMARRFETVHKWCVTGTPIQKSINDLFGLFVFLDYSPYDSFKEFRGKLLGTFCSGNAEPLVDALCPVLWRNRKIHVEKEIEIPPQKQIVHWLKFTPVEEHFYQQQHGLCREDFLVRIFKFVGLNMNSKISTLDRKTFNTLLYPLLRLRQASIHPQMVRGHFVALRHVTLTMEELLRSLIKKTQVNCEESQRCRVAATNGLAALHIIKEDWVKAAECYRDVLRWADELKDSVKTDTLQRLHALSNLAEVLQIGGDSIPRTLRDSDLKNEAEELRKQYLGRVSSQVEAALQDLSPVSLRVTQLKNEAESNRKKLRDGWWLVLLEWTEESGLGERCVQEIREKLEEEAQSLPGKLPTMARKFNNINGLRFLLFNRLEEMEEQRTDVMKGMKQLELTDSSRLAKEAVDCHLRIENGKPNRKNQQRCQLCTVHDAIEDYESLLFRMADRQENDEIEALDPEPDEPEVTENLETPNLLGSLRKGTWADSEAERMLKFLSAFSRKHGASSDVQDGGTVHLKLMESYKKEFRLLRVVWRQFNDQASAVDELSMANLRLRLRLPGEEIEPRASSSKSKSSEVQSKPNYILDPHEVEPQFLKLKSDLISASNLLKKHMGHVLFLKNLERNGYGKRGTHNPDLCPVCQTVLGSQWSVLRCGHSYCMDCVRLIIGQHSGTRNLRCPVCRETNPVADIAYVDTQADTPDCEHSARVEVKGSHSTKVEAVVRQLLLIQTKEPGSKCLVFSTWTDVLLIIARALDENSITYRSLFSHNFQANLTKFKHDPSITVLLIPVQSGANGLNLVEASHVLLVEPILNPGSELQAIGRVHRIGQTKPTVVHKFYIRGTIEERMTKMLEKHHAFIAGHSAGSSKENPVTIADLKSLFEETENETSD